MPEYPKRPQFFAFKFCRLIARACLANEIGPEACWLLSVIAMCEDAKHYRAPVTYYNDQLSPLVGAGTVQVLDRMRRKAIDAGWLDYTPGKRGVAGRYFVTIPPEFCGIADKAFDENPLEYGHYQQLDNREESNQESGRKPTRKAGGNQLGKREESNQPSSLSQKSLTPPPPKSEWAAVAVALASLGIGDTGVRPDDLDATPTDCLAIIEHFKANRRQFSATDPFAVLHSRIRSHVHGMDVATGWTWKSLRNSTTVNNDPEHVAMRKQIEERQKRQLAAVRAGI